MKIAIISDIHDNLVNLQKCLLWCKENGAEKIICCGDVTNGETLKFLSENFSGEIFLVRGNLEIYQEEEIKPFKNYTYGGRTAVWEIGGKKIGVCHEPFLIKEFPSLGGVSSPSFTKTGTGRGGLVGTSCRTGRVDEQIIPENKLNIVFYGHTHKPWIEDRGGTLIVNPGTLGGVFSRATFAFYDTAKSAPELKILDLL